MEEKEIGKEELEQQEEEQVQEEVEEQLKKKKRGFRGGSSKKIEALEADNEELTTQVADVKDKYLRLMAEFDNYKKRTAKEKIEIIGTAAKNTISSLLPVVDDFGRAIQASEDDSTKEDPISEGLKLTIGRFVKALEGQGLKEMVSTGEVFDPELHEALTEIPAPTEELKGKVVVTIQKGYLLGEKIIRHAQVVVGK